MFGTSLAELPESTAFAETYDCRIDHSLYKLSEGGTLRHLAGCIDSDIVSTITLAMATDLLMSPIDTCKFGGTGPSTRLRSFVSYKRGHFVSPLKCQSQNASAAIASCAKEKDFHNCTSSLTTRRCVAW